MGTSRAKSSRTGVFEKQARRRREVTPRVARSLMLLITSFLVFAVVWSVNTEMRQLVRAEGEIAPKGELRRVDHFDGGMIAELHVAIGATVEANEILATIDLPGLADRIAELEAELSALSKDIINTNWLLDGDSVASASADVRAQRTLFLTQQKIMGQRIDRLIEAAKVAASLHENAKSHLSFSEMSLDRLQSLHDRGVVSQAKLILQAEEAAETRSDLLRAEASLSQAKMDIIEAKAARSEAYLSYREQHLTTLGELERSRQLLKVRLAGLIAQKRRQIVRSPEAGIIQSSGVTTIGEVVPPGGLLFELLPSDERLVAIVQIDPKDVGHVEEGSNVVLKLATFDARRYGEARGTIELISPTSVVPDQGPAFYRAIVALEADTVGAGISQKRLRAGMTLSAEIETSKRSVLSYLLKPIQRVLDHSLTER